MTEAMPFLQKTILLSYDPRPLQAGFFVLVFIKKRAADISGSFRLSQWVDPVPR